VGFAVISEAKPDGRIFYTKHSNTFSEAMAGDQGDLKPGQWKAKEGIRKFL